MIGDALSQAEVSVPPHEAGRAIARLLATRGFSLVAQHAMRDGLVLRFKGHRELATDDSEPRPVQLGSTFFVAIVPAPGGHALVSIDGAPITSDDESCRPEAREACYSPVSSELSDHVNGRAEAEVVHGVFSELALEGLVVDWERRNREGVQANQQIARERCTATRHRMLTAAYETDNKREQARLIAAAPSCL